MLHTFKHADPLMVCLHFEKDSEISRTTMTSSNQSFHNQSIIQEDVKRDSTYRMLLNQVVANHIIQRFTYLEWKRDMTQIIEIIEKELEK